jgi:hypothetical protein
LRGMGRSGRPGAGRPSGAGEDWPGGSGLEALARRPRAPPASAVEPLGASFGSAQVRDGGRVGRAGAEQTQPQGGPLQGNSPTVARERSAGHALGAQPDAVLDRTREVDHGRGKLYAPPDPHEQDHPGRQR